MPAPLTAPGRQGPTCRCSVTPRALPPAIAPPPAAERPARAQPLATTSAPPLQAAVSAATSLIGGNKAGGLALPDDGVGVPGGPAGLATAIEADFRHAYFVSGAINGAAYAPGAAFVDPTITVTGLGHWRSNIAALRRWLVDPSIDLEGGRVGVVAEQPAVVLRAAWRLRTGVALPWRPAVDVRGETVYECEAVEGGRLRVFRHTEAWRTPAWRAVAQLLVPGGL